MIRIATIRFGLLAVTAAIVAAPAWGATVSPTKNNGDFIAGTGIPANNFTVAAASSGDAVALKGRLRDTGQPLSQSSNVYYVPTGLAADNVNPAWSIDFQFTPRDGASYPTLSGSEYWFTLEVDFDPTIGVANFKTISSQIFSITPSLINNPGFGAWSNNTTPWVLSDSTHLGFNFWAAVPPLGPTGYDPNATGEYEVRLTASEVSGSGLLATRGADIVSTNVLVRVVPEPASLALMGVATIGGLIVRRRSGRQN